MIEKDVAETDQSKSLTYNELTMKGLYEFFFIPLEDYNAVMGTRAELSDGEALVYCYRGSYPYDTITFNGGRTLKLEKINALYFTGLSATSIIPSMYFIVPDVNRAIEGLPQIANIAGDSSVTYYWDFCFDTDLPDDRQHEFASKLNNLSSLFIIWNAKHICTAASPKGRKNTVSSCEFMLWRISFLVMPTFCIISNLERSS